MHVCTYCKKWPCICRDKPPNKPWKVDEMRAYFTKADTWTFLSTKREPCPVPGCLLARGNNRTELCNFHDQVLPMDICIQGRWVTRTVDWDGMITDYDFDMHEEIIAIAVASEAERRRLGR
jgi:hypothetical protein